VDDIVTTFESRGLKRGGILLLKPDDAIELVEAARQQRKPILGVDAFTVTETSTQPSMEHSADYSDQSKSIDTWSAARHHIEKLRDSGFLFEVVV
jgi:hypothetical protein